MKIKSLITAITLLVSSQVMAQNDNIVYDLEEDSLAVTTLKDIIDTQQKVLKTNTVESHITDVWKRSNFFNLSYSIATLKSEEKVMTESNPQEFTFKSDWGASMQSGRNYLLHNKPIANTVAICLDYSWIDLNLNHYKAEPNYTYNSSQTFNTDDRCSAWGLEKYELTYAMTLGPSITVAPLVSLNNALSHFRVQGYYHIGYSVSGIYMVDDKSKDTATSPLDEKRIDWGHGLVHNFGVTLMWKGIGVGYEHRSGNFEYQPTNTKFGQEKSKFSNGFNRIYIQFRT